MAKSAKNLDVNIVLSKCEFIGVAAFERIYGNQCFRMYLPPFAEVICKIGILSKYAAGQTQYFEKIQHFQRQMCSKC